MTKPIKPWTPQDLLELNNLIDKQRLSWISAGEKMERSWAACKVQYFYQRRLAASVPRPESRATKMTKRIAAQTLADEAREERQAIAPRSLTAETFGDPPAGRSALDRKRSGTIDDTPLPVARDARFSDFRGRVTLATEPSR